MSVSSDGNSVVTGTTKKIQKRLEKGLSNESRVSIEKILENVGRLSNIEKLLLYLKLPTNVPVVNAVAEQSKTVSNAESVALTWVRTHLTENATTSLLRQKVYDDYRSFCESHNYDCANMADFGKVLQSVFPGLTIRRLGKRGSAKHMYGGISYLHCPLSFTIPKKLIVKRKNEDVISIDAETASVTTNVAVKDENAAAAVGVVDDEDDEDEDEDEEWDEMVTKAASRLILEWAYKLTNVNFGGIVPLAEHLLTNNYVNNVSKEAFTVAAASNGRILVKDPGNEMPIDDPAQRQLHTRTQLQKKLQERQELTKQRKKMEEERNSLSNREPAAASVKQTGAPLPSDLRTTTTTSRAKWNATDGSGSRRTAVTTIAPKMLLPKIAMTHSANVNSANNQSAPSSHQFILLSSSSSQFGVAPGAASLVLLSSTLGSPVVTGGTKNQQTTNVRNQTVPKLNTVAFPVSKERPCASSSSGVGFRVVPGACERRDKIAVNGVQVKRDGGRVTVPFRNPESCSVSAIRSSSNVRRVSPVYCVSDNKESTVSVDDVPLPPPVAPSSIDVIDKEKDDDEERTVNFARILSESIKFSFSASGSPSATGSRRTSAHRSPVGTTMTMPSTKTNDGPSATITGDDEKYADMIVEVNFDAGSNSSLGCCDLSDTALSAHRNGAAPGQGGMRLKGRNVARPFSKTVSSILDEQRGRNEASRAARFHNDNRNVSQILKELREKPTTMTWTSDDGTRTNDDNDDEGAKNCDVEGRIALLGIVQQNSLIVHVLPSTEGATDNGIVLNVQPDGLSKNVQSHVTGHQLQGAQAGGGLQTIRLLTQPVQPASMPSHWHRLGTEKGGGVGSVAEQAAVIRNTKPPHFFTPSRTLQSSAAIFDVHSSVVSSSATVTSTRTNCVNLQKLLMKPLKASTMIERISSSSLSLATSSFNDNVNLSSPPVLNAVCAAGAGDDRTVSEMFTVATVSDRQTSTSAPLKRSLKSRFPEGAIKKLLLGDDTDEPRVVYDVLVNDDKRRIDDDGMLTPSRSSTATMRAATGEHFEPELGHLTDEDLTDRHDMPYKNDYVQHCTLQQLSQAKDSSVRLRLQQQQLDIQKYLDAVKKQNPPGSRSASAIGDVQLGNDGGLFLGTSTQPSRPNTVAFGWDEQHLDGCFESSCAALSSSVDGSRRSTPLSVVSPRSNASGCSLYLDAQNSFVPINVIADALPTVVAVKPMPKHGQHGQQITPYHLYSASVAHAKSSMTFATVTGSFVPYVAHGSDLNRAKKREPESEPPASGFAPVSSILPAKRSRAQSTSRHRHRSAHDAVEHSMPVVGLEQPCLRRDDVETPFMGRCLPQFVESQPQPPAATSKHHFPCLIYPYASSTLSDLGGNLAASNPPAEIPSQEPVGDDRVTACEVEKITCHGQDNNNGQPSTASLRSQSEPAKCFVGDWAFDVDDDEMVRSLLLETELTSDPASSVRRNGPCAAAAATRLSGGGGYDTVKESYDDVVVGCRKHFWTRPSVRGDHFIGGASSMSPSQTTEYSDVTGVAATTATSAFFSHDDGDDRTPPLSQNSSPEFANEILTFFEKRDSKGPSSSDGFIAPGGFAPGAPAVDTPSSLEGLFGGMCGEDNDGQNQSAVGPSDDMADCNLDFVWRY